MVMLPSASFWRGKRVLLTGHTGFKGAWLALWLHRLGAEVTGISLAPSTQPHLFGAAHVVDGLDSHFCDIRNSQDIAYLVRQARPELVLHLAAQALVRPGYREPLETFATNVMGTAHVLDALRGLDTVRAVVAVTTDKVYSNREWIYPYREDDALGGHDPYSASKAAAEMVITSYRKSYLKEQGVAVASARAGNVIGGGDWSQDRLIPDAMRAWSSGEPLQIRRPQSTRPWQHVLEPLAAYLRLAEQIWLQPGLACAYNFGPLTHEAATVREVIQLARRSYGRGEVVWCEVGEGPHEAGWLALEISKARATLGVQPYWPLEEAVGRTVQWYRLHGEGADCRELCEADIVAYEAAALVQEQAP